MYSAGHGHGKDDGSDRSRGMPMACRVSISKLTLAGKFAPAGPGDQLVLTIISEVVSWAGAPPVICCAMINSRAVDRKRGQRTPKKIPPMTEMIPPIATVHGAPMLCAILPAMSAPNGAMPMNIME